MSGKCEWTPSVGKWEVRDIPPHTLQSSLYNYRRADVVALETLSNMSYLLFVTLEFLSVAKNDF